MLCSSPMSMKMLSKTPVREFSPIGTGSPHCNIYCNRPTVLRQTLLPPAFGPLMTRMRCRRLSAISSGTIFLPCRRSERSSIGWRVHQRSIGYLRRYGTELTSKPRLGPYELYVGQKLEAAQQFLQVGPQRLAEFAQDTHHLALLLALKFANAIVGLHHFLWLDEDGFARGTLVVHDTTDATLQCRRYGYHKPAVAHGGRHVFLHEALSLCAAQDACQRLADTALGTPQLAADIGQLGAGFVLDAPKLVENLLHAAGYALEGEDALGHLLQRREVLLALFLATDERNPSVERAEREIELPHFLLLEMLPLDAQAV